eukprot:Plantae.Rhodophyta-Rhodochaete_pulchella.ctg6470.p1 GENE.Plantae.Rhodophyta-Rhodochaete_pulchella.ctg6470~~Plantae.Rhodophyta-Rhodochaete_pulchella.ctg6470.p1  ORF type:complete len:433 (+),score=35.86 Plantae.Rhodophyta-Rhodochaete_pulchella.ctg6470:14-1312(+)
MNPTLDDGERTIRIFVREVVQDRQASRGRDLHALLYLQGGPGFESPRPVDAGGFVKKLADSYRVFLMDQRGTGLSAPISVHSLQEEGNVEAQVSYLKLFRSDAIVRDAEIVRRVLLGPGRRWSILGQSFGGFCCLSYLSFFPDSLSECFITGGLAPITAGCSAERVYSALEKRVRRQMDAFYEIYPQDEGVVRDIVLFIDSQPGRRVPFPHGYGNLTVSMFQLVGESSLGFPGGFAQLHYLLERAFEPDQSSPWGHRLTYFFLKGVESRIPYAENPLYAILHEAIYCNGGGEMSNWAAHRVVSANSQFDAPERARRGERIYLTGEMVFPYVFEEIVELQPLRAAAQSIAESKSWPTVYDEEQLSRNKVPVAAVAYYNDMYVDFKLSEETASRVNGLKLWVTSEYTHAGLRQDPWRVIDRLRNMLNGSVNFED